MASEQKSKLGVGEPNHSTRDTAMTSMILLPPFPGDDSFAHDATTWLQRAYCVTMSSCEAELVALADLAIELLHVSEVAKFLGHEQEGPYEVRTDSKSAYDLCHRFTSAQNSRHVDRKLFKMRELRGAGRVVVRHMPGDTNPADLFTKILTKQPFEKHRKFVLNLAGDTGMEHARRARQAASDASSTREGTGAP